MVGGKEGCAEERVGCAAAKICNRSLDSPISPICPLLSLSRKRRSRRCISHTGNPSPCIPASISLLFLCFAFPNLALKPRPFRLPHAHER